MTKVTFYVKIELRLGIYPTDETVMKKLIFFSIFIFFTLTFSRTFLVPEDFLNIQQAVVVAQNGDTVSVNFGRPNGQRITVSTLRIMSKEITFEVRGEGKERLLDMIKDFDIQPTTIPDTEWTEQQMVNSPDATPDDYPHIAVDTSDRPWVIWSDGDDTNGFDLHYTKWNGSDWDEETGLFSQNETRHLPRITFDDQNRAWVVYSKQYPDNTHDIFFTRCVEGSWEPERMVNLPDSTDYDFGPGLLLVVVKSGAAGMAMLLPIATKFTSQGGTAIVGNLKLKSVHRIPGIIGFATLLLIASETHMWYGAPYLWTRELSITEHMMAQDGWNQKP